MDDAELVRQAVAGDRDAFAALYDRYAPRLYDFLRSLLRDPDEAADAVQDTFVVAGARLHQLRDPEKVRPWLYAIARHRGLRAIEQRNRHRPLEDVEVTAPDADPADMAADPADMAADRESGSELVALVAAAAEGLGPRDQVVLELHLRQGLEGQELGDAIGVSASHAYVLVSRLRDQVERSLGALLVARQGRDECPDLAAVLEGWDGRFTPVWRKRVARHVDGCAVCGERRRGLLTPATLFGGAAPAFALPAGLRDRVLGEVELCSHTGPPWPGGEGGFPPPLAGASRRRRPGLVAAAVAVLILVAAAVLQVLGNEPASTEVAAVGPPPTAGPPAPASTTVPTGPPTTSTPGPSTTSAGGTLPPLIIDPVPGPGPGPTTTTGPSTTTTTPVGPPADTTPPALTVPRLSPATVRAGSGCSNNDPRVTTVSVRVSDATGIASVVVEVGGPSPSSAAMTPTANGFYQATIGPFAGDGGTLTTVPVTVRAVDVAGNQAASTGSLAWRCDPIPG